MASFNYALRSLERREHSGKHHCIFVSGSTLHLIKGDSDTLNKYSV